MSQSQNQSTSSKQTTKSMVDLVYERIIGNRYLNVKSFNMPWFNEWGASLAKEAYILDVCRENDLDCGIAEYARVELEELASDANVREFDIVNALCTAVQKMGINATMGEILRESDLIYLDSMIEHSEYEQSNIALNHKYVLSIARAWDVSTNRAEMVNELTTYYTLCCLAEKIDIPCPSYLEHEKNIRIPRALAIEQFFHLLQDYEREMDPLFRLLYSKSSGQMMWSSTMDKYNDPSFTSWLPDREEILDGIDLSDEDEDKDGDEDDGENGNEDGNENGNENGNGDGNNEDKIMIEQLREKAILSETVKNEIQERFSENLRFSQSMSWWSSIEWLYA